LDSGKLASTAIAPPIQFAFSPTMPKWLPPVLLTLSVITTLVVILEVEDSFNVPTGTTLVNNVTYVRIIDRSTSASEPRVFVNDSLVVVAKVATTGDDGRVQDNLEPEQSDDLQKKSGKPQEAIVTANDAIKNKTMFVCGWPNGDLASHLFPEFVHTVHLRRSTQSSADSLLVHGFMGPCLRARTRQPSAPLQWMAQNWKGKVLVTNVENTNRIPIDMPENLFGLGMSPDSDRFVYVSFFAIALIGFFDETEWGRIFTHTRKPQSTRQHFCIYFVSNCVDFREVAVDEISTSIKRVDQWGRCAGKNGTLLNQIFGTPQYTSHSAEWQDNIPLYRQYRFCLVMENSIAPGYITEKILNAFLAGCIPIYYGPDDVFEVFNRNAFVFYNVSNPSPALDRIRHLEENETAYLQVSREEPILAHGNLTIDKYFSLDDAVGNGTLKRKIRVMLGLDE
jgi:Glycosyltransferase family 10 (fucosyltransferase) C-term